MKDILILTTATLRPEIFKRTYESFWTNLFDGDESVCLNIDCIGNDEVESSVRKIIRRARYCFKGNLVVKVNRFLPNFTDAFLFVWQTASTMQKDYKYVFYLEDDWILNRKVDLGKMIEMMESDPLLAILRFSHKNTDANQSKNWNVFFPWDKKAGYFRCPQSLKQSCGMCGHPSLIKMPFVVNTSPLLNREMNPEKQFHRKDPNMFGEINRWEYGVFSLPNEDLYIKDIGREWMIENKFQKKGPKSFFTEWEIANGTDDE